MNRSMYLNSCSTSTLFQRTTTVNDSSILHINLDHNYCTTLSDNNEQAMTPKRRKVLSGSLQFL